MNGKAPRYQSFSIANIWIFKVNKEFACCSKFWRDWHRRAIVILYASEFQYFCPSDGVCCKCQFVHKLGTSSCSLNETYGSRFLTCKSQSSRCSLVRKTLDIRYLVSLWLSEGRCEICENTWTVPIFKIALLMCRMYIFPLTDLSWFGVFVNFSFSRSTPGDQLPLDQFLSFSVNSLSPSFIHVRHSVSSGKGRCRRLGGQSIHLTFSWKCCPLLRKWAACWGLQ